MLTPYHRLIVLHNLEVPVLKSPLMRYRVIAYVVSTFFAILCFVGIPLQIWAHSRGLVHVVGALHGFLYPVYLILTLELAIRYRFSIVRTLLVMAAGTIPLMGFVAERNTTHFVTAKLAARDDQAATAPASAA